MSKAREFRKKIKSGNGHKGVGGGGVHRRGFQTCILCQIWKFGFTGKKKKNKLNHLEIETFFLHIKNLFYIVGYNLVKNSFLAENYK